VRAGLKAVYLMRRLMVSPVTPMYRVSRARQLTKLCAVTLENERHRLQALTFTRKGPIASNGHGDNNKDCLVPGVVVTVARVNCD
jgi:hypothetical protein